MNTLTQNPDVIIIGAGASGLSAAKTLQDAGLETLVLEADDHVGGRCFTDTTTFATPFDRGGSWLHSASINPLPPLATDAGIPIHKSSWQWHHIHTKGKRLTRSEVSDYKDYSDTLWDTICQYGGDVEDRVIEKTLPPSKWQDCAKNWVPQMLAGDCDVTSAKDVSNYKDTYEDWLVGGGLGDFIKHLHSDVSVMLNCPVSKIDYSGKKISITTPKGTIETDHVVLTVSVGILAAGKIEFSPALPNKKLQAINDLPNGLLNKVGIEFSPVWKEAQQGEIAVYHRNNDEYCTLLFGFYNTSLTVGFVAGRFAAQLEKEGKDAATSFCLEGLRKIFGNDVEKYIKKTSETAWNGNPNTYGAYSYALPGRTSARETLAETVNEKLFFAGEATMPNEFATVHGAYLSGKEAAKRLLTAIDK